jgi:hypothetical protein
MEMIKPKIHLLIESADVVVGSEYGVELGRRCVHTMKKIYKLMDMWNQHCGTLGESAHQVVSKSLEELLEELGLDENRSVGQPVKITLINSSGVKWLNAIHKICLLKQMEGNK